jgi:hypothetical protein
LSGRKRKVGVKRTSTGRISRAADSYQEHVMPIQVRMRMHGLTEPQARDQKAATVVGRLWLTREISTAQYDASQELLRLHDAYKRAIRAPDGLRNTTNVGADDQDSDAYAEWCKAVIAKYQAADRAITHENMSLANRGCNLQGAVYQLLTLDQAQAHLVPDFRVAMNAAVRHFGISR